MEIPDGLKSRDEAGTPTWHLFHQKYGFVTDTSSIISAGRFLMKGDIMRGHQGMVLALSVLAICRQASANALRQAELRV
jgi:hypothetical protein